MEADLDRAQSELVWHSCFCLSVALRLHQTHIHTDNSSYWEGYIHQTLWIHSDYDRLFILIAIGNHYYPWSSAVVPWHNTWIRKLNNVSNYVVYYIFLPTLTATQDRVRCDTLHVRDCCHCSRPSRTTVTAAQTLSRGPKITRSWTQLTVTDTNRDRHYSGAKYSCRMSCGCTGLYCIASPRYRPHLDLGFQQ